MPIGASVQLGCERKTIVVYHRQEMLALIEEAGFFRCIMSLSPGRYRFGGLSSVQLGQCEDKSSCYLRRPRVLGGPSVSDNVSICYTYGPKAFKRWF